MPTPHALRTVARPAGPTRPPRRASRAVAAAAMLAAAIVASGCSTLADIRDERPGIRLDQLKPPAGHGVAVLATGIPKARHMALTPRGTLFVGTMSGEVHALTLAADGRVAARRVIASGLRDPSGVAFAPNFAGGTLYVADRTRIVRFEGIEARLDNPPAPVTTTDGLPDEKRHDAHAMAVGTDGKLYVSVGAPCNVCEPRGDEYGTIIRTAPDGSGREVVARGLRNSVGFDWHPRTGELWLTENGQDELGPDRPNDELNRVSRTGEHFGFPYCHDRDILDPKFGAGKRCADYTPPAFGLGPHVAALGMRFVAGAGGASGADALVARHGSHPPTRVGYDVVRVRFDGDRPVAMEPFLTGFLQGRQYWGRPVDVLRTPDGAFLVSDDLNGAIYRVAPTAAR